MNNLIKRVIFFILAAFFASSVLQNCRSNLEFYYKWNGFILQVVDYSERLPIVLDTDKVIDIETLGFQIVMTDTAWQVAQQINFNLITECLAFQTDFLYHRLNNMVSITVKTIFDYSVDFPAGTDISALFEARSFHSANMYEEFYSIDELILFFNAITTERESQKNNGFYLYLMDDACIGGQQKFEITIVLSDETVLIQQTDDLLLKVRDD